MGYYYRLRCTFKRVLHFFYNHFTKSFAPVGRLAPRMSKRRTQLTAPHIVETLCLQRKFFRREFKHLSGVRFSRSPSTRIGDSVEIGAHPRVFAGGSSAFRPRTGSRKGCAAIRRRLDCEPALS